jgi:phosphoribosylformimino-5-aminoimidazole carboxamide ribotide isomerase
VLEDTALDLGARVNGSGLGAIVYTDIARDGMLTGVNVQATTALAQATDVPVIASGGVAGIKDVEDCLAASCDGVILGKALYEGKLTVAQAVAVVAAPQ